jgi:hypothetical protein
MAMGSPAYMRNGNMTYGNHNHSNHMYNAMSAPAMAGNMAYYNNIVMVVCVLCVCVCLCVCLRARASNIRRLGLSPPLSPLSPSSPPLPLLSHAKALGPGATNSWRRIRNASCISSTYVRPRAVVAQRKASRITSVRPHALVA